MPLIREYLSVSFCFILRLERTYDGLSPCRLFWTQKQMQKKSVTCPTRWRFWLEFVAGPALIPGYTLLFSFWVHLVLLWPIVPAPDDRYWWLWSNWWNEDWQGKPKYLEKSCPTATLSTTNPTWPDPCSNPGRRGEKPELWHSRDADYLS
jgi:hypothetical protein